MSSGDCRQSLLGVTVESVMLPGGLRCNSPVALGPEVGATKDLGRLTEAGIRRRRLKLRAHGSPGSFGRLATARRGVDRWAGTR